MKTGWTEGGKQYVIGDEPNVAFDELAELILWMARDASLVFHVAYFSIWDKEERLFAQDEVAIEAACYFMFECLMSAIEEYGREVEGPFLAHTVMAVLRDLNSKVQSELNKPDSWVERIDDRLSLYRGTRQRLISETGFSKEASFDILAWKISEVLSRKELDEPTPVVKASVIPFVYFLDEYDIKKFVNAACNSIPWQSPEA